MKNSKKYSQKIKKLYATLKKTGVKVVKPIYDDPIDAMVYAVISERMKRSFAHTAHKRCMNYFVDLNDLRVSRPVEICSIFGRDTAETRRAASTLIRVLTAVYDHQHDISLQLLGKVGKRQAKQDIEELDGITHFVVNYCVVTAFKGHAIPLTDRMIDFLQSHEMVSPGANPEEIEGFLNKQVAAKDGYEFYELLRKESESAPKKTVGLKDSPKPTLMKKAAKKKVAAMTSGGQSTTKTKIGENPAVNQADAKK
ncbi:MAG: hypothetical protein IIA65_09945, partial [Planctomycetes bacterium]|nr:hypothetical protein [Planctomycetota bacterium]